MKIKHLLIGLFAVAATVACKQDEPVETPSLEVSQESLALAATEAEASFEVTANVAWTATADQDWVSLDPASGDASKDAVTVTVTAENNTATEARTATVTVKAGDLTKTVALTQAAAEAEDPGEDPGTDPTVPEVTELYMLGAACDTGWGLDQMTAFQLVEGVLVWEGNLKVDDFRFPLQKQSNVWWPCLVPTTEGKVVYATGDNQVENPYRVESEGYYKVTVNVEEMTVTFERLSDRVEPSLVVTELYLLGDAVETGWSLADMPAFENNNGVFTWTGHLKANARWRFPLQKVENGWWPCLVLSADGTTLSFGQGDADDTSYLLPQSGIYTLTFNLANWDNRSFTIELVEADPETEKSYTVAGTFVSAEGYWKEAGAAGLMALEGDYYVAKGLDFKWRSSCYDDSANQNWFEFKVVETGTWNGVGASGEHVANTAIDVTWGGGNINLHSPEGVYDVYFDEANLKVWVMKAGYAPGDEVPEDEEPEPVDPSTIQLYMLGSGCSTGWELDKMTAFENNNGILTWTGYLKPEEFRFPLQKQSNVWWPCYMISPDGTSLVLGTKDDDKVVYTVDYPGTYTITINATDVNNPTVAIEETEISLSLVGTIAGENNGWNKDSEAGKMTKEGEYFVLKNAPLVWRTSIWGGDEDYFDFKVCAFGTWDAFGAVSAGPHAANTAIDLSWGGTEIDVVAPEGNYDVYYDPAKRQIWFMTPGYMPGEDVPVVEPEPVVTSVADFLAAPVADDVYYRLKGTITSVANTTYGNFDLTDDTGTVYIYGLLSEDGATNKYWAASGAKLGDDIVVSVPRAEFNGTPQGKNAHFVELVSPGTRAFYTLSTEAVDFASAGGDQVVTVSAYNTDAAVTATSDNDKFAVSVNGYNVTITSAANEVEEKVSGNVTVKVGDLATKTVKVTLAAKPAEGVVEGGQDDFHTISSTNTSYVNGNTTAGWAYANCAIFKGGATDSSPAFVMIGDAENRALCMNGKTTAIGTITSPTFSTGCGTLKFNYGLPFADTKIKFRVDIKQNETVVKTFTVEKSSATKYTLYSHEEVINVSGDFQIIFTNLCPSNSTSNKDRTAVWDVEWTGYQE